MQEGPKWVSNLPGPPLKFQLTLRGVEGAPSLADCKSPSRCCLCHLWAAGTVTWTLVFSDFSLLGRQRGSCCTSISFLYLKRCQICPKCHKGSCQGTRLRKVLENSAPSPCKREAKAWGTSCPSCACWGRRREMFGQRPLTMMLFPTKAFLRTFKCVAT